MSVFLIQPLINVIPKKIMELPYVVFDDRT